MEWRARGESFNSVARENREWLQIGFRRGNRPGAGVVGRTSSVAAVSTRKRCGKKAGGTLAIIYMPSNRTMTVAMSQMAGSTVARWYDPTNGSYTADAASPVAASGTHNFSRSGANAGGDHDWVLVLEA